MNLNLASIRALFRTSYDRIALFAVLAGLLFSVGWLVVRIGEARNDMKHKPWALAEEQQKAAAHFDAAFLDDAIAMLGASNDVGALALPSVMIPARRVACVKCHKPILFNASICLYCGQPQPDDPKIPDRIIDTDNDGLPDDWESKYGFNPNSAADANTDPDEDYFTNREEFQRQTHPRNKEDAPPLALKLRLVKVTITPLNLVFTSINRITGTNVNFTIKNKTTQMDYFPGLGGKVEGYTVVSFEEKYNDIPRPDMPNMPFRENVSVVTMQKEDRTLKLVMGKDVNQDEIVADIKFLPDDTAYSVKINDVLDLKSHKYNVVDIKQDKAVISSLKSPKKIFEVKKDSVDAVAAPQ